MYKGEAAELYGCVTSENSNAILKYLWSAVAIGVYNPETIITGGGVEEEMDIVSLYEPSDRNNGISSIRKGGQMGFDGNFYTDPAAIGTLAAVAAPATLYDRFLAEANGWFEDDFQPIVPVKLLVHVTGGSIKSKLADDILFPRGLSADLPDLWEPSPFFRQIKTWRGMSDEECFNVWGNNNGVLAVMSPEYSEAFIRLAARHNIMAKRSGTIKKRRKMSVTIKSGYTGKRIVYQP